MFGRIKDFFMDREGRSSSGGARHDVEERHLAAAALLVEAASLDQDFDENERARIRGFATGRLGLDGAEADALIAAAETAVGESTQLYRFVRAVMDSFDYDERLALVETLWEVVYADGEMDAFEAQMMRRIGGLLHIEDRDRGEARKRALARLGRAADG
jgi:uncharacterized tellurite resistance protein B-like protein